jgi:hypothetical protein
MTSHAERTYPNRSSILLLAAFIAMFLALLAGSVAAQQGAPLDPADLATAAPDTADMRLEKQMRNILTVHLRDAPFDWVEAAVQDGKILLTGRAANAVTPARIIRAAARLDGVTTVYNNIEILPVSLFDDQLRYQAARAVYTHPMFSHRVLLGSPSIHLVVAAGKVQIEGTVSSKVEARLAESLVRSSTQNFGVENNLVVTARNRG